jgi:hypothetical protein
LTAVELTEMEQLNPKTERERIEEQAEADFLRGDTPHAADSKAHHP